MLVGGRCGLIPVWQLSQGFSWPASPSQDLASTALYQCLSFAQLSCLLSLITATTIEAATPVGPCYLPSPCSLPIRDALTTMWIVNANDDSVDKDNSTIDDGALDNVGVYHCPHKRLHKYQSN